MIIFYADSDPIDDTLPGRSTASDLFNIINPDQGDILSYNGSHFTNTDIIDGSTVDLINLNADNLTSGTIPYARLPIIDTSNTHFLPPYISSIPPITPSGSQVIEITGEYFTPQTVLAIPDVIITNIAVKSPNRIIASIEKTNLTTQKPIVLSNGINNSLMWDDGIKTTTVGDALQQFVALFIKGIGSNNSTNIIDESVTPKNIIRFGDVKISTIQSKYGGSSLFFDGNGDYLEIINAQSGLANNTTFTLEAWLYPTAPFNSGLFDTGPGQADVLRHYNGSIEQQNWGGIATPLIINQWTHLAIIAKSNLLKIYKNGVLLGTKANFSTYTASTLLLGSMNRSMFFTGYMDSIRLTLAERYTVNFNPETDTFLN